MVIFIKSVVFSLKHQKNIFMQQKNQTFYELSCVEGFFKRIIIMNRELIIREGNIFIEEQVKFHSSFTLKLCSGREIYKIRDFQWNGACRRWQQSHLIKIPWPTTEELPLQIQVQDGSIVPQVIAEGIINLSMVVAYLHCEIRIPLTYDGAFVGYLYCVVSDQQQENYQLSKNFLYMHKIEVLMLEEDSHGFKMRVLKNEQLQFQKDFHLHNLGKVLFPNLKVPVKMSDVLSIDLPHHKIRIKPIKFVIDSVKRGKTATYEVWLRNTLKNRVGNLKIEYFIENLYLENERQIFIRKGIVAQNIINPITAMTQQEKGKLRMSVIKQIEEAGKRIMKMDKGMRKLVRNTEAKQNNPMHQSSPAQVREYKSQQNHKKITRKLQSKVSLNFQIPRQ